MRAGGVEVVAGEPGTAVGPVAALAAAPGAARTLAALVASIRARPRVLVTIDAPALWSRVGALAASLGVPWIHWVAPQVWASRAGRVPRFARSVDTLLCLFPFEAPIWRAAGARVVVTGHPACAQRSVPRRVGVLGLAPGSRRREISAHQDAFLEVADRVLAAGAVSEVWVSAAPGRDVRTGGHRVVQGLAPLFESSVVLSASGTATLELAAAGTPMVVAYALDPLSARWARSRLTVPWVSWPNLLAGRAVVEEHLGALDAAAMSRSVLRAVAAERRISEELAALVGTIRVDDPGERAAEAVLRLTR
jgi:lipid-A-disaccharide synthase